MIRRFIIGAVLASGLMGLSATASAATVTSVYACSANTFNITLSNGTILNVWLADPNIGMTGNFYDHLYAMSLELLASGRQVGTYETVGQTTACGQTVTEIKGLTATSTP